MADCSHPDLIVQVVAPVWHSARLEGDRVVVGADDQGHGRPEVVDVVCEDCGQALDHSRLEVVW